MKIIISLLIVIIGAIGTLWFFQQQRIADLNSKNASLLRQNESLSNKNDESSAKEDVPPTPSTSYTSDKGVKVTVTTPARNAVITSPLNVSGEVPGSWSFEASFGTRLIDSRGTLLAESPASLQGDWMTDDLVPFTATMEFENPVTKTGALVLLNANPSGLPENEDTIVIPVRFSE